MDIGTTGTDTGGGYPVGVYNNGKRSLEELLEFVILILKIVSTKMM